MSEFFASIQKSSTNSRAWVIGLLACITLFLGFCFGAFDRFSSLSDSPFKGVDYITLPRCGLAARHGTDVFRSHEDYSSYGQYGGFWASHPMMCFALGAPLSFLSPKVGYWFMNCVYLFMHCWMVTWFLLRLPFANTKLDKLRDAAFALLAGFSMPWYVAYNQGNYHIFSVFGLFLLLRDSVDAKHSGNGSVFGYCLSAFAKPLLAPLALVTLFQKKWKILVNTGAIVVAGNIFVFFLKPIPHSESLFPYTIGFNESLLQFLQIGQGALTVAAYRWNQIQSLHSVLQETAWADWSFEIRLIITSLLVSICFYSLVIRRNAVMALACLPLWYIFMNTRGHEYHWTLLTPILLCLYVFFEQHRNHWTLLALALTSLPNSWFLFHFLQDFQTPNEMENTRMLELSPFLYYWFLIQKPLAPLLILLSIIWKSALKPFERPITL
jgi:hypothetical protein